ncbi:protein HOTHEAD-like isoform X1 [Panicum hallii]|uniref:protein HOTHEAD-like isoform X1 n=1 Tax=Panicum hallii TaxID=206008 RepID=UPI000DF4E170|nr:protein HOTHEAD-like isoform X1 [Panicum hallii]
MAPGLASTAALLLAAILGSLCLVALSEDEELENLRFVRRAQDAPLVSRYNYIVIGGGTSGCPLAATLSEHSRVLLLERGGLPYRNMSNQQHFTDALADTSPASPAQRFISEDGVVNARARVLGGGSCLNAGFYTRASNDYVRAAGWDARLVNSSYRWVERALVFRPDVPPWQAALRDALLEAGVTPDNGFTFDHVTGTKIGGTIFDSSGQRHTAADFLRHARPGGLTVLLYATVSRILFRQQEGAPYPVAYGVVFADPLGVQHRVYLKDGGKNEVILSAGTLGSPQLLMLSGVGPQAHLEAHGIQVLVDQPMVGQGVADNPMNSVFIPSPVPVALSLVQVVGITRSGSFIEGVSGSEFGIPVSDGARRLQRTPEALQRAAEAMRRLDRRAFRGGFILEKILGPVSSGHIELRSTDPRANPVVTFNYFQEKEDLDRCVHGIETIERVIQSQAFSNFTYANASVESIFTDSANFPVNLLPRHANDSRTPEQYCKDTVMTIWHYHGGCQVGAVVDDDYRVFGVQRLRVIDSSTFKYSPGTNPQATVMMLGRYMGVKIQAERWRN